MTQSETHGEEDYKYQITRTPTRPLYILANAKYKSRDDVSDDLVQYAIDKLDKIVAFGVSTGWWQWNGMPSTSTSQIDLRDVELVTGMDGVQISE